MAPDSRSSMALPATRSSPPSYPKRKLEFGTRSAATDFKTPAIVRHPGKSPSSRRSFVGVSTGAYRIRATNLIAQGSHPPTRWQLDHQSSWSACLFTHVKREDAREIDCTIALVASPIGVKAQASKFLFHLLGLDRQMPNLVRVVT
jgi:hypothetical protein